MEVDETEAGAMEVDETAVITEVDAEGPRSGQQADRRDARSYEWFMATDDWYGIFELTAQCTGAAVTKAYRSWARYNHPDKGGDTPIFAFVTHVFKVLTEPGSRGLYDMNGRAAVRGAFPLTFPRVPSPFVPKIYTERQKVNVRFVEFLMRTKGAHELKFDDGVTLASHLRVALRQYKNAIHDEDADIPDRCEHYKECDLAESLGRPMRLYAADAPLAKRRLVRNALLTGMPYVELDLPASHPQQIFRYAKKHDLKCRVLTLAAGSAANIKSFRLLPDFLGIKPEVVKEAVNMMSYGSGMRDFLTKHGMASLHPLLLEYKEEVAGVIEHMAQNCPAEWKVALSSRPRWRLTLLSVHCQIGERVDLDTVMREYFRVRIAGVEGIVEELPGQNMHSLFGWLGDSMLWSDTVDDTFLSKWHAEGIFLECKRFPKDLEEYAAFVFKATGKKFDTTTLAGRALTRLEATERAWENLYPPVDDKGKPLKVLTRHTDIAIAIEHYIQVCKRSDGQWEVFNPSDGRWVICKDMSFQGELVAEALEHTFADSFTFRTDADGRKKLVLAPNMDSRFRHGPWRAAIEAQLKILTPVLKSNGRELDHDCTWTIVNFDGQHCLDFSKKPTEVVWSDDVALDAALTSCVRLSTADDRIARHTGNMFTEYENGNKFELARALRKAMLHLEDNDTLDDACIAALDAVAQHHTMLRKVFYEAHRDWDSAIYQLRCVFEPVACRPIQQIASFVDSGEGSTAKGTVRELCEASLGVHTAGGNNSMGYCCIVTPEAIKQRTQEAPSEVIANLALCKHAWVDDFEAQNPLSTAVLRSFTGGNNLTAARKHKSNTYFKFRGVMFLACNGLWRGDQPFVGADDRRCGGLTFSIRYVSEPEGPNEALKDPTLKANIRALIPEFFFVARVLWAIGWIRKNDETVQPLCPNAMSLRTDLLRQSTTAEDFARVHVGAFIEECLCEYVVGRALPSTCEEIRTAFHKWLSEKDLTTTENELGAALRSVLEYKPGCTIPARGGRTKTTRNVYRRVEGMSRAIMTLK
eukprot:TRINITY_DN13209_c0_g1_i3.p1 TRINITY_DN13209_c0_g1~~TRINITY_DN13209_c0_g1_i3.p1  ORF type:complete len:1103 (+),score=298.55 TRINITY_DN13209_c0_g1_i3:203-3310(+)